MEISRRLLVGPLIEHEADAICRALASSDQTKKRKKDKKASMGLWFVITTCPEADELLYILSSIEYKLPLYKGKNLKALGIAGSKEEAIELVRQLVDAGTREGISPALGLKEYFHTEY